MAIPVKQIIKSAAATLSLAVLGSCGSDGVSDAKNGAGAGSAQAAVLFPDNFKGVCSGATVSAATAYDPAAEAHKALYFATYKDDLMDQSSSLPGDWTVLFSPNGDALKAVDTVVCAKRVAAREVKVCDGYKDHGNVTQNKVLWHTATYEISVWEAKTGKKLAQSTAEATDSTCPMFMNFDNETDTVDGFASLPDSAVTDFLRPYIVH